MFVPLLARYNDPWILLWIKGYSIYCHDFSRLRSQSAFVSVSPSVARTLGCLGAHFGKRNVHLERTESVRNEAHCNERCGARIPKFFCCLFGTPVFRLQSLVHNNVKWLFLTAQFFILGRVSALSHCPRIQTPGLPKPTRLGTNPGTRADAPGGPVQARAIWW